jgi:hypothetical protein
VGRTPYGDAMDVQRPPSELSGSSGVLEWCQVDEIGDVGSLQEKHRVDVRGADPRAEVKMRLRDFGMAVTTARHDLFPRYRLSLSYSDFGQP